MINCAVAPQKRSAGVSSVVLVPVQLALGAGGFYYCAGSWKSGLGWSLTLQCASLYKKAHTLNVDVIPLISPCLGQHCD